MPTMRQPVPTKLWWLLGVGPVLFFLAFVGLSIALALTAIPADQIESQVTLFVPHVLLFTLTCLGMGLCGMTSEVKRVWRNPRRAVWISDIAIGCLCGVGLAVSYFLWLAPLMEGLQRTLGDFVPPGSVLPTLSNSLGVFFVANVLLAPWVEETLYRGIALPVLSARFGPVVACGLSCTAFGLLHWAGGFWYIVLTGLVAGGCFAGLYHWRAGILAPFTAHLTLNMIEFGHAYATAL